MYISDVFRALKRRWYATALIVIVALVAAVGLDQAMAAAPTGTATAQILVDSPVSSLVNLQANDTGLEARAAVLAQAMTSNAVLAYIARAAGVPVSEVTGQGPFTGSGEVLDVPTPSEARGQQLVSVKAKYRLAFVAQTNIPIITVSVIGPNATAAGKMANAVEPGTLAWLASLATLQQVGSTKQVHLRQLGDAQAGTVNSSSAKIIAGVGFIGILILGALAIALTDKDRRRRGREESGWPEDELFPEAASARTLPHAVADPFRDEPSRTRPANGAEADDVIAAIHGGAAGAANGDPLLDLWTGEAHGLPHGISRG